MIEKVAARREALQQCPTFHSARLAHRPHKGRGSDERHAGVDERNLQSVLLCDACLQHEILPCSALFELRGARIYRGDKNRKTLTNSILSFEDGQ